MIKNKKVIGVCLNRFHDTTRSNYINFFYKLAEEQGYKVILFNSFVDYFHKDAFDDGAKAVYDLINHELLDALIVHSESFCDKTVSNEIVARAQEKSVPVIMINEEKSGCYAVLGSYEKAYKSIIRHVISEHGVTDTFFVAGNKEGDEISRKRIRYYREVLEENGLTFDEGRVGYGGYWEGPTRALTESLVENGKRPPQAIICANDYMAFTVCEVLEKYGYHVPQDVLVTGFDGIPSAEFFNPQMTTCNENLIGLAQKSMEAVNLALDGGEPCILTNEYIARFSESCGCKMGTQTDFRQVSRELCLALENMGGYEESALTWVDRVLSIKDMNSLYVNLAGSILKDSYACLNSDFVVNAMGNGNEERMNKISEGALVVHSKYSDKETSVVKSAEWIPDLEGWVEEHSLLILTAMYAGSEVCGYFAVKTEDVMGERHQIKRAAKTVNIACTVALNYFRQMTLRMNAENATLTNAVTNLPNLKGTVNWFEDFSSFEGNHQKALSVSVYGLPKYTYIYENYGIKDVEEVLRFVAESLKIANPSDCFIGHISEDEFVIVNYYDDENAISETINNATSVFYSVVEGYNSNSEKDYFVEVNCGCTVVYSGWEGSLEGFIKFANSEMYMNRLKMGGGAVVKEKTAPKEHYKALELLIEKNLFNYHFQPIVNAKSGEIYAYEALMRTDPSIGMNPLEVLDAAKEYNCLYEIEYATMFNIMERYAKERDKFGQRKVFINTIPGYFLKDEDITRITDKYGKYMDSVVFELTEQNTVSDEELDSIRRMSGKDKNSRIAIDDYGTGHSNIVNLMRYAPHIIKIDRFLISDIHKDQNKQMFVRSTIEFARMNGIMVLAEGVETSNELRMVIDLGVDLIQGYYTGRPVAEPIAEIALDIKKEILDANPLFGKSM